MRKTAGWEVRREHKGRQLGTRVSLDPRSLCWQQRWKDVDNSETEPWSSRGTESLLGRLGRAGDRTHGPRDPCLCLSYS